MSESYEILLLAEFSAAHRLRLLSGDWEPLHGHNWKVEVHVHGPRLDAIGLLADFTQLQPNLNRITAELHDTYLNELPALRSKIRPRKSWPATSMTGSRHNCRVPFASEWSASGKPPPVRRPTCPTAAESRKS